MIQAYVVHWTPSSLRRVRAVAFLDNQDQQGIEIAVIDNKSLASITWDEAISWGFPTRCGDDRLCPPKLRAAKSTIDDDVMRNASASTVCSRQFSATSDDLSVVSDC